MIQINYLVQQSFPGYVLGRKEGKKERVQERRGEKRKARKSKAKKRNPWSNNIHENHSKHSVNKIK